MSIKLKGSSDGSVSFDAPADTSPTGTDVTFVLPTADGTAEQVLKTDGSGNLSFADNVSSGRNLIINGAMKVAQRGTTSTGVTATGYYGPDRFRDTITQGTFTISQSTTAPDGFSNSLKYDCTTAATLTGGNVVVFQQRIEAQDLQHLKFGTSSAEELTLSFWVRSNLTGVFTVEAYIEDDSRQISREVTISSANTWEYKTVSIPGDTVGVIDNDNGPGMDISFWLDSGPDRKSGTLNTSGWASLVEANRISSNNISFASSTANEFFITGVQLEVNSVATKFEHRSYGDELLRCQRYYYQASSNARDWGPWVTYTANGDTRGRFPHPVNMRAAPTCTFDKSSWQMIGTSSAYEPVNVNMTGVQAGNVTAQSWGISTNSITGQGGVLTWGSNSTVLLKASAEL